MPDRKYRLLVENPDVLPAEDVNSIRVRVRAQSNVTLATPGATPVTCPPQPVAGAGPRGVPVRDFWGGVARC